jgi:transposase
MAVSRAPRFVGIDVSKHTLDIACLPTATTFQVDNDAAGWTTLIARVRGRRRPVIVCEATGRYHRGLVAALAAAGLPVAVVNPAWTHAFIASEGQRTKTDRTDARLLARSAQQKQPPPTPLPSASARQLKELVTCRAELTKLLVMEKNRRQETSGTIRAHHQGLIAAVNAERALLDTEIATQLASDPDLTRRAALLRSVPGLGDVLVPALLAGLPELGEGTVKGLAALAGVAPHLQQSGTHAGQAHIQGGRRAVRTALYQLALTATQFNPAVAARYHRLLARGKSKKVALIACARWLVGILNAMLRDGLTWSETRVGQERA